MSSLQLNDGIQFVKDWIAALRSGKYQQCLSYLRADGCFCAIGVGCDVLANQGIGEWRGNAFFYKEDRRTASFPWEISKAIRNSFNGVSEMCELDDLASSLNDTRHDFKEIADKIEEALNRYLAKHG